MANDTIPEAFWSTNWAKNFESVIHWSDAISVFCSTTVDDHKLYLACRAAHVSNDDLRDVITEYGPVFGHLLDWIHLGIKSINHDPRTPEECLLDPIDLNAYRSAWNKHITTERQSLNELKSLVDGIVSQMTKKKDDIEAEDTDGHSSYSDYSETDTESDDFEEEEEEDDDEEEPTDALRRKKSGESARDDYRMRHNTPPRKERGGERDRRRS